MGCSFLGLKLKRGFSLIVTVQTARYADEALASFIDYLKKSGLYDTSVIILFGDHYGISNNHTKAMEQLIGKEVTAYESAGLQRTPLFIHVPSIETTGELIKEEQLEGAQKPLGFGRYTNQTFPMVWRTKMNEKEVTG